MREILQTIVTDAWLHELIDTGCAKLELSDGTCVLLAYVPFLTIDEGRAIAESSRLPEDA